MLVRIIIIEMIKISTKLLYSPNIIFLVFNLGLLDRYTILFLCINTLLLGVAFPKGL